MKFFEFGRKREAAPSEEEQKQMEIAALEKQRRDLLEQLQLNGGHATAMDSADLLKWQHRINELKGLPEDAPYEEEEEETKHAA